MFVRIFPKIEKLEKLGVDGPYAGVIDWFIENEDFMLHDSLDDKSYDSALQKIKPLIKLVEKYVPSISEKDLSFYSEFVLWSLVEQKKLSKNQIDGVTGYKDNLPNFNLSNN